MSKQLCAIDLRPGTVIDFENSIWRVISAESSGTGRGANYTKLLIRNLYTDSNKDIRVNPEVKIRVCTFEHVEYFALYDNGDEIVCNDESGNEIYFAKNNIDKDIIKLITDDEIENIKIVVQYLDEKIFKIGLPKKFPAKIVETEPHIKKQTASASYKPAILVNGWKISVPQFIEEGEKIIVDSETKEYTSRIDE
jgi:elongation factor P